MLHATTAHLRLARPTAALPAAERFWTVGAGAGVLWRAGPDEPHAMLAVGFPGAAWHLELVEDGTVPTPTAEDLLVLYLGAPVAQDDLERLTAAGGRVVAAHNPYWDRWGTTVVDPDGYRLVLSHRSWGL
ncbi:VOC family protein [Rhodococcus aerolatus]